MILRPELQPAEVDSRILERLTKLASEIDGGKRQESKIKLMSSISLLTPTINLLTFRVSMEVKTMKSGHIEYSD